MYHIVSSNLKSRSGNLLLIYIILAVIFTTASNYPQTDYSFSGYGAAGFRVHDRNQLRKYNQEVYYEGKLQFNYSVNKDIEAQLDLRGNSDDNRIILREFSVKFEYIKQLKFKIGNIKKPFGSEELLEREEMTTIDRSYAHQSISDFGYGGRAVSVMAYYNYSKKRSDYPYSYFVSFFKDNSFNAGMVLRGSYHFDNLAASINYAFLNKGGEYPIDNHGLCANLDYEDNNFKSALALFYVRNPYESLRRQLIGINDNSYSTGINISSSYVYNTDAEIIKKIEPVILFGYFSPDSKEAKYHTLEMILGSNFYFHKDVRLRLNGDLLLTKNLYNSSYSSIGSKVTMEIQVCI